MRLRRFKGTVLVSVLVAVPFVIDGCAEGQAPGASGALDIGGTRTRDTESGTTGRGTGLLSVIPGGGSLSGLSRGGSSMGGTSVSGSETGGAEADGSGPGGPGRNSLF